MLFTFGQRRSLKQGVVIVLLGLLGGLLYVAERGELSLRYSVVNSVLIGLALGLILAVGELNLFRRQVRRVRFVTLFLMRSAFYFLAVILVTFNVFVVSRMRRFDISYADVIQSDEFSLFLREDYYVIVFYSLLIMATVNFTSQMNRKLGPGMLWAYITGKYKYPVRQNQIIMFIDLVGSRNIIRRLGAAIYHDFLNDVIFDITEPIIHRRGSIVHYVDDEIVVSWSMEDGIANANCIRTYFDMSSRLYSLNERYYDRYGFIPGIRAAVHSGTVIRAEVGSVKTEVCAVGDVMNTTSRVLDLAIQSNIDLVVTASIKRTVELPVIYNYENLGINSIRGKVNTVEIYSVQTQAYVLGR